MSYQHFLLVGDQDCALAPHHCSGQRALCPDSLDSRETCLWASHFTLESVSILVLYLLRSQVLALLLFLTVLVGEGCVKMRMSVNGGKRNQFALQITTWSCAPCSLWLPLLPRSFWAPNPSEMWADCTNPSTGSPRWWDCVWRVHVLGILRTGLALFVYFVKLLSNIFVGISALVL